MPFFIHDLYPYTVSQLSFQGLLLCFPSSWWEELCQDERSGEKVGSVVLTYQLLISTLVTKLVICKKSQDAD